MQLLSLNQKLKSHSWITHSTLGIFTKDKCNTEIKKKNEKLKAAGLECMFYRISKIMYNLEPL